MKAKGKEAINTVSAFGAHQRMVLGQVQVDQKSNEITAIPALLDMLDITGALVTIDAMGCQRDIASKINDKSADYILALKGNQGTLCDDIMSGSRQRRPTFIRTSSSKRPRSSRMNARGQNDFAPTTDCSTS